MTRLYHLTDNVLCKDLGIVSRYNVRAVLCDEYDTSQPGIMDAIEDICDRIAGVGRGPEYVCDVLNCMCSETTIDEVEDMAIDEVRRGAYIADTYSSSEKMLVGFSWQCVRALQAVYCGYDCISDIVTDADWFQHTACVHLIGTCGLNEEEARVLNHIIGNQCKC